MSVSDEHGHYDKARAHGFIHPCVLYVVLYPLLKVLVSAALSGHAHILYTPRILLE